MASRKGHLLRDWLGSCPLSGSWHCRGEEQKPSAPHTICQCPMRESEASMQRGAEGAGRRHLVVAVGLCFWKVLWLRSTPLFLWLGGSVFSPILHTSCSPLPERTGVRFLALATKRLLIHTTRPLSSLSPAVHFSKPYEHGCQRGPLKSPWVMFFLSPKGLSMVLS